MSFTTHSYSVSFVTPAFLGNAEQQGQWRTPPFKALLRQWWRVANAARCDVAELAKAEGELFGVASDEKGGSRRSRVQIRLSSWSHGKLTAWSDDPSVKHPEVKDRNTGEARPVGSHLYLGYGPLSYSKGRTSLENKEGRKWITIEPEYQLNTLSLRFPEGELETVLQLIQWFGTMGGRSRNGWGSLNLQAEDTKNFELQELSRANLESDSANLSDGFLRPWRSCLKKEWPHAIGTDENGPLVWIGKTPHRSWSEAIKELAEIKIKFRTAFGFSKAKGEFDDRHLLAYPVTNHPVHAWREGRLANQIRFKVRRDADGYRTIIRAGSRPERCVRRTRSSVLRLTRSRFGGRCIRFWTGTARR